MILQMVSIAVNQKEINDLQIKNVGNKTNRTSQTNHRAILIRLITVNTDTSNVKRRAIKNNPIKLCARLTAKLLMTAYKSKIFKFNIYEDPIWRRIYFFTFVESLDMIFSQNKETYEVLLDYQKKGGYNIKDIVK